VLALWSVRVHALRVAKHKEKDMERELWNALMGRLGSTVIRRPARTQYTDQDIVRVILWAALHDRPISWACRRASWPRGCGVVPDASTVSRRSRTLGVRKLLRALVPRGRVAGGCALACMDGKPLMVSRFSKDRDARFGHADGGMRRGYKLHAICDRRGRIRAFDVRAINEAECRVACKLVTRAAGPGAILLADASYDSNALYGHAASRGARLVAPRRKANRSISPSHAQHPDRVRAIERMEGDDRKRRQASRLRSVIERTFGWLTMRGGGTPPPWARTLPRVRRWVMAKLAILHAAIPLRMT